MNPTELEQRYAKAVAAHQAGRLAEAEAGYAQILKVVPGADAVLTNMAALQFAKGNHESALSMVDKALKVNPLGIDALINRASILAALGRNPEATEAYRAAIAVAPRNALSHYNFANLLHQSGDRAGAIQHFRIALDCNPDLAPAAFNLGNLYVEERRHAEALPLYEKALALTPTHEGALRNLTMAYAALGMANKALQQVDLGIELLPNSVELWNLRSLLELENGYLEEAVQSADTAIDINRDNAEAWVHRGNALRDLHQYPEASEAYQMALALSPNDMGILRNLRRVTSRSVPRWHFTMLADKARNAAFDMAIQRAVKPGDLVLDIGTGSGLLAMMAARAGASKVVACEAMNAIADTAKTIVAQNGYSDRVSVYGMHSGHLKLGTHLPKRADVIVTEILDAALLGEGMLPSIRAALHALAKPGAKVVPAAATVVAQLVHIPSYLPPGQLSNVEGFDVSEFERFRVPREYEVIYLEALHDHGRSEIQQVREFVFTELQPAVSEMNPELFEMEFLRLRTGWVNALALWFLLDLDGELRVNSGPGGELRHWGQAVFFFDEQVHVQAGGSLKVNGAFSDMMWQFWLDGQQARG